MRLGVCGCVCADIGFLTARDAKGALPVIVINQTLARSLWPGQDPLGRMVLSDVERTVVGVVGDVRHIALEQGSGNEFYIPIRQIEDYPTVDLVVKETVPGIKGATASAQIKPATLETGLVVNVPSFINEGDKIRVNTETGEYQSRV